MAGVLLRVARAQLRGGAALTAMALTGAGAGLLFSGGASLAEPAVAQHPRAWDSNWDRRGAVQGGTSRTLILVRHGQYANSETSSDDAMHTLTPLGREQADTTGARLATLLRGASVVSITHSTMTRAAETASLIAKHFPGVPLQPCSLLREGAPVRPEPDTWRPSEAEVWEDGARIEAAFRRHFHRAEAPLAADGTTKAAATAPPVEVLVCHGNVIRFSVLRALQLPPEAWLRLALANGSITKVVLRADGGVSLHGLGDTGHFKPEQLTYN